MRAPASLRQSLRRQFLVVGLLPLLVVMAMAMILMLPSLLRQGEQRNLELATAVRDQVQQELEARRRTVSLVAVEVAAGRLSGPAAQAALHALTDQDDLVLAAYLTNGRGIVELLALPEGSGLNASDMIGLDQSAHPHVREAQRTGQPVWSETFLSPLTDRVTAVLVVPAGERLLIVELALDHFSRSLAEIGRAAQTQPIVIDRAGRVIGHPDPTLALRQENLRNYALVSRAIEGQPGAARIVVEGRSHLAQALPVAPVGWTILVMQPTSVVLGPLLTLGVVLATALAITMACAIWLSWFLSRRSGREVERLVHAAETVLTEPTAPAMEFHIAEFRAVWARLRDLFAELYQRDRQAQVARRDLQAVLDAATEVAIIATDLRGMVTVFSIGAQKMLQRTVLDVVGCVTPMAWHDAAEIEQRARELALQVGHPVEGFEALACQPRHAGYEVRDWTLLRGDGLRIDVSLAVTAMRSPEGELKGFLCVAIDISQRRHAVELDTARRVAEAANEAKSEFLSRMSHELRTPLNAILGYAQLMELSAAEPPTAAQQRQLSQIQRSGWHLVRLIDEVLDLSRIESGHMRVALEPVMPAQVVSRSVEIAAPQMRALGLQFQLTWLDGAEGSTLAPVRADMTRLTQVLVNLLSNAAKYNRPGGSVRLECGVVAGRGLVLRVIDTGLGMDATQLAQLFQPFNRLGRETGPIEGHGIGLVITRRLLELMHGTLEVSSVRGEGSVFTVTLPQAEAEPAPALALPAVGAVVLPLPPSPPRTAPVAACSTSKTTPSTPR